MKTKSYAYYAHCMALYNTPQESRDIETIEKLGFEVINPNAEKHKNKIKGLPGTYVMQYFCDIVKECEVLFFRALPDLSISAGVATEIKTAREYGRIVIELPTLFSRKTLSIEETTNYLKEIGQK